MIRSGMKVAMRSPFVSAMGKMPAGARFNADDIFGGTLVLNFVDPPDITLSLNFLSQSYQSWEDDTTIAGLVGYYEVKA